jgi:hypothetical protein
MGKKVDLKELIRSKSKEFFDTLYTDYRPELDANITILDLSYESLKVNVYLGDKLSSTQTEVYNRVYDTLYTVVKEKMPSNRTFYSLEDPRVEEHLKTRDGKWYIFLVDGGKNHFFLVGRSFDSTRNFISDNVSSDPRLSNTRFGTTKLFREILDSSDSSTVEYKTTTRSKVDIGHIPSEDNENLVSPLEKKVQAVLDLAYNTGNSRIEQQARKALQDLYDIQASFAYSFKNTSQEDINTARRILGKGYVVVTLHTKNKNAKFSKKELAIFNKLIHEIALSLPSTSGSNTIIQDLTEEIVSNLTGEKKKVSAHGEHAGTVTANLSKKVGVTSNTTRINIRARNRLGQFTSLAGLQTLLNQALAKQIRNNMGTGSSRNILNNRTGRLSESAKVERLSLSREGMITAFYSYMKYPYATFSEGGRQELPRSRDPKLLISKSIRELAATLVLNRMRAVNI